MRFCYLLCAFLTFMVYYVLMSGNMIDSKKIIIPESAFGVCFWETEDGLPLHDVDYNMLCAEGLIGDTNVEKRVKEAALYWSGNSSGNIRWVRGARKISGSEYEDQKDRLKNGLVADPYESAMNAQFNIGKL